jgi:hypothetical protein
MIEGLTPREELIVSFLREVNIFESKWKASNNHDPNLFSALREALIQWCLREEK